MIIIFIIFYTYSILLLVVVFVNLCCYICVYFCPCCYYYNCTYQDGSCCFLLLPRTRFKKYGCCCWHRKCMTSEKEEQFHPKWLTNLHALFYYYLFLVLFSFRFFLSSVFVKDSFDSVIPEFLPLSLQQIIND